MSLRDFDLNMLVTLDALLQEKNVTRAARRLGVTQPSVSAALRRLRRHFDDELLRRNGSRYELTSLAELLATQTAPALLGVQRVLDVAPSFDPGTSEREFTLMMSDYATAVFADTLAGIIAEQAPGVRLTVREVSAFAVSHAAETLRSVDGIVLPHGFIHDVPSDMLWEDVWVCIVARDNADVDELLTLEQLKRMPWVVSYNSATAFTPAVQQLRTIGIEPDIRLVTESFLALPFLVAGTDRIALLQARLADRLSKSAGVRTVSCPWDVSPLVEAFWWHPAMHDDPAHAWLRSTLCEAGGRLR
ncbi:MULTISPECIES: LysR family transcriptional regulator [Actinomycetes]|uniref:LysR family transcriptional regulator n=1 Tax=Actinomycetes TaxID=1760 RepID=UPI000524B537|nr:MULTISPECIES: LysR family transcriptional regulator [Actinomycetes]